MASALLLTIAAALAGCQGPAPAPDTQPAFERVTFATIPSIGGHHVPITVYRPDGATADAPVPVVLHSHGWGGSRETRLAAFANYTDAGLGVVSIDMRGHGEARATSASRLADPQAEGRDVQAVIDHVAGLDWVRAEARDEDGVPGASRDPVLGVMGESYAGAFALLAAAGDPRVDAVVAENTWNDLVAAMLPNGVPKTAWFASLWLSGALQTRMDPELRNAFEEAIRSGAEPQAAAVFRASSLAAYPGAVRVPTLLVQGANDTLFDLGQALANHALVTDGGGEAALVVHLGGHSLASPGQGGGGLSGAELRAWRNPCGDARALALAWFRLHLLGDAVAVPAACIALDDGVRLQAGTWPPVGLRSVAREVPELRLQAGNLTASATASLLVADTAMAILGVPRVAAMAQGAQGTVYVGVQVVDAAGDVRLGNGQAVPLVVEGPGAVQVDLAAVALHLRAGESLRLVVLGHHGIFPAAERVGDEVVLRDITVTVPLLDVAQGDGGVEPRGASGGPP